MVSIPRKHTRAKATVVSNNRASWSTGPRRDTHGWRQHESGGIALHERPTRRRHAASRIHVVQNPHCYRYGGSGGSCRGAGGRRRGLVGRQNDAPNNVSNPAPLVWRAPEGPEGTGGLRGAGPGRGAGGWRQGQGGPRDRPLRAQLACGDLAGGPPPTGTHSGRAPQSSPAQRAGRTRGDRRSGGNALWRWGESNPRPNAAPGTPAGQQATQEPLHGIAKGAGISRPLERVPSLIHEGHLDATHQRGDDVVEHGAQR